MRQWAARLLAVLVTSLGVTACSPESARTQVFEEVASPTGEYRLVALVITPRFPQGPHQVALELARGDRPERQRLLVTELAWDGVPFTRRNIGLRWTTPQSALVCLSATDRPDKAVRITVPATGPATAEMHEGC